MDQFNTRFPVYDDVSSAGNHFTAIAAMSQNGALVSVNGSWATNPHSGATATRFELGTDGSPSIGAPFGGFLYLNGVFGEGDSEPALNFGEIADAGINLSGATSLSFWARGEDGGERIEFFMGGAGYANGTGAVQPGIVQPDSTRAISRTVTLSTQWRKYTISLARADLSYVLNGFGWSANMDNNPDGAAFYVDDVQYNLGGRARQARLNQPRFLVSYKARPLQPDPFDTNTDDDIDLVLRNMAFSYDNALALLAYLAHGSRDSLRRAQLIGDAFVYATTHDRTYTDGRVRSAYAAGDISLPPGWAANGRAGTVPIPGFYSEERQSFYEVEQGSVDTGNNAWTMVALLALYRQTGAAKYLDAAARIGQFIRTFRNDSGMYQGFLGGIDDAETDHSTLRQYASVEHNEDVNAAFTMMAQITGDPQWEEQAGHARRFVEAMFDPVIGLYRPGTVSPAAMNTAADQLPVDVQAWSVLSNAATLPLHTDLLDAVQSSHGVTADGFSGFDFNADLDGVWFEGTAQMAVANAAAGRLEAAESLRAQLRKAQRDALTGNRYGLAAASHEALTTGFNFRYFRRLHVGATSWNVFAQLAYNPYYRGAMAPVLPIPPAPEPPPDDPDDPDNPPDPVGTPKLQFTEVPGYGSTADLVGRAAGVDRSQYRVAVFIKVSGGWWNKPYWNQGTTSIASNGLWQADITTNSLDRFASDIAAFLVPVGYQVPLVSDAAVLPEELATNAVAQQQVHRAAPPVQGDGTPSLELTSVPAIGTYGDLSGRALHIAPVEYQVAVFIRVGGGWWSKPTWAHPAVPIDADGTWVADITTGGIDQSATDIAAFLVPVTYDLPRVGGSSELPAEIGAHAAARVDVHR